MGCRPRRGWLRKLTTHPGRPRRCPRRTGAPAPSSAALQSRHHGRCRNPRPLSASGRAGVFQCVGTPAASQAPPPGRSEAGDGRLRCRGCAAASCCTALRRPVVLVVRPRGERRTGGIPARRARRPPRRRGRYGWSAPSCRSSLSRRRRRGPKSPSPGMPFTGNLLGHRLSPPVVTCSGQALSASSRPRTTCMDVTSRSATQPDPGVFRLLGVQRKWAGKQAAPARRSSQTSTRPCQEHGALDMGAAGDPDHRRRRARSATSCAWDGAMSSRPRRPRRRVAADGAGPRPRGRPRCRRAPARPSSRSRERPLSTCRSRAWDSASRVEGGRAPAAHPGRRLFSQSSLPGPAPIRRPRSVQLPPSTPVIVRVDAGVVELLVDPEPRGLVDPSAAPVCRIVRES